MLKIVSSNDIIIPIEFIIMLVPTLLLWYVTLETKYTLYNIDHTKYDFI